MKDCFGLHSHSAFGYVAKRQIGVGQQSLLSQVQLTDPSHWLQAGKTVDILRYAAESTDLLPPSALPRQQVYLLPGFSTPGLRPPPFRGTLLPSAPAACDFPRPPALRDADYRLPPVIVLPSWIVLLLLVMVMASSESSRSAGAGVVILLLVVLLYMEI